MSKKGEPLGRTYDELKFVDVLKKRYSEANNTLGSVARLRLVVCKDHQRSINKKNLVPKVIEKQAGHGTTFKVCLPAAEIR
jgi:hypothetical protein